MNFLNATRGIEKFIPIGICSGAYFALRTALSDRRVVGAVPIDGYSNPTARYYWNRFTNLTSWRRVITGKVDVRKVQSTVEYLTAKIRNLFIREKNVRSTANLVEDVRLANVRDVDLLLVYAKGQMPFYNFVTHQKQLRAPMSSGKLRVEIIENSDHLFTPVAVQEHLMKIIQNWIQARMPNRFCRHQEINEILRNA